MLKTHPAPLVAPQTPVGVADIRPLWCVVITRGTEERKVAERLTAQGFTHYLPLRYDAPLYPNYLFAAYPTESKRHEIKQTRGVLDLLVVYGPREARLAADVASLRIALANDPNLESATPCKVGVRVKVVRGPYIGMYGTVTRRERVKGGGRAAHEVLEVGIRTMGRVVCVENFGRGDLELVFEHEGVCQ